ncbi:MAG: hypothetical protein IJJ92_04595 [Clostridia bacterium]|nr:hypothetical protein [Clostridia bacterium]
MLINPFRNKKTRYILPVLAILCVLLFVRFGVIGGSDSKAYITASIRVSPLYPSVIALLRLLAGESAYLQVLAVLQCLLLAYSIYSLMVMIGERFGLSPLLTGAASLGFFGLYLLRLFIVGEEALYCVTVMTEAVTYPVYYLFVKYAFSAWDETEPKYLLTAAVLAFVLAVTRGQLICLFLVLVALFLILLFKMKRAGAKRSALKRFTVRSTVCAVCYFLGITLFSCVYHFAASGTFTTTTMGKEAVLGAVLYNSSASDIEVFDHGTEAYRFLSAAMTEAEQEGLTYKASKGGVADRFRHYEASHDELRECLLDHIKSAYGIKKSSTEARLIVVSIADTCLPVLLRMNFGRYLGNCAVNAFGGLVRSNSILRIPGIIWSFLLYGLSVVFLFLKNGAYKKEQRFLSLILLSILINALFCSFGVFELSRYVYYNFPCFYLALFLIAYRFIHTVKNT